MYDVFKVISKYKTVIQHKGFPINSWTFEVIEIETNKVIDFGHCNNMEELFARAHVSFDDIIEKESKKDA